MSNSSFSNEPGKLTTTSLAKFGFFAKKIEKGTASKDS